MVFAAFSSIVSCQESSPVQCKMSRYVIPLLTLALLFCIPASSATNSTNSNGILACFSEPCLHGLCIDHTNRYPPSSGIGMSRLILLHFTPSYLTPGYRCLLPITRHLFATINSFELVTRQLFTEHLDFVFILRLTSRAQNRWMVEILDRSMQC